jgi:hypothetical protein
MTKKQKINLISTILLIGFCIGIFYHFVINGIYKKQGLNPDTFLCCSTINFSDMPDIIWNAKGLMPYTTADLHTISAYFPLTYILIYPLQIFNDKTLIGVCMTFIVIMMIIINYYFLYSKAYSKGINSKIDIIKNVFIFSFLSYPFLFLIDRLNIEFIIFLFCVLFLISYLKGKDNFAIIFLSIPISMKLYPAVLLFLFLKDKKYQIFIKACFIVLALTLLSLLLMKGELIESINGFMRHFGFSKQVFGTNSWWAGVSKSTTLFGLIKIGFLQFELTHLIDVKKVLYCFYALIFICGILIFIFLMKYETELWKIVFILIALTVLFNYTSFVYRLISMLLPIWLFINKEEKSKYDYIYASLFGVMMIPLYYSIKVRSVDFDFSAILIPILLIIFIALIVKERFNTIKLNNK